MKIIYCHHANRKKGTEFSQDDDITLLGEKDANLVRELLETANAKNPISAIYSSKFFRCTKTANIINTNLNLPIILDERLNEKDYNGKEEWKDCQERVKSALLDIIKKHENHETVLVVTSGVNISAFINLAYGLESSNNHPFLAISMCCPIMFDYDKSKFNL